jgi:lysozyme
MVIPTSKDNSDMAGINLEGRAQLVVERERAQVVSTLEGMLELSRRSAEEAGVARQDAGITQSLQTPEQVQEGIQAVKQQQQQPAMVDVAEPEQTAPVEPMFDPADPRSTSPRPVLRPTVAVDNAREAAVDQLKLHEGYKPYPYKDSVGKWTIGIGHLIGDGSDEALAKSPYANFSEDNPMPEDEVQALFDKDYEKHARIAEQYPAYQTMNETGKLALIDMTFNMGDLREDWSGTLKLLEEGRYEEAAVVIENSKYARQVGNRAKTVASQIRAAGE